MIGGWYNMSRDEQHGFIALLIIMLLIAIFFLFRNEEKSKITLHSIDSANVARQDVDSIPELHINYASVTELLNAGFSNRDAITICKYRDAGGYYLSCADLKKTFFIDTVLINLISDKILFDRLQDDNNYYVKQYARPTAKDSYRQRLHLFYSTKEELLQVGVATSVVDSLLGYRQTHALKGFVGVDTLKMLTTATVGSFIKDRFPARYTHKVQQPIDLNIATVEQLDSLRGIGPAMAKAIVDYREKLGGFVSIEQLKEIYALKNVEWEKFSDKIFVGTTNIVKLKINTASATQMSKHPYIYTSVAQQIEYLRKRRGAITTVEQLEKIPSYASLNPLVVHYISFELE